MIKRTLLGKKAPVEDKRTFKLSKYLALPTIPAEVSWITKLVQAEPLPMYLNDTLGDCVVAAAGHMEQQWNFYAGHPYQPTDADILKGYEDVGGYVPGDPSTDNGTDMLSFLKYWRKQGLGGHKIAGFASVDPHNDLEVRAAILLFGNLYIGVALPLSAQEQTAWTVTGNASTDPNCQPGGWGGHCIPLVASSPATKTCITWGETLKMSHNFFLTYCDESFVVFSQDWLNAQSLSPSNFNVEQLKLDLSAL